MKLKLIAALWILCQTSVMAQGTLDDYRRAKEIRESFGKVYQVPQQILWSEKGECFSYRATAKGGKLELYIVDAVGKNKLVTDIAEIENQLKAELGTDVKLGTYWGKGTKVLNAHEIEFVVQEVTWKWNAATQK